jgi:hypothetical protein
MAGCRRVADDDTTKSHFSGGVRREAVSATLGFPPLPGRDARPALAPTSLGLVQNDKVDGG